MDSPYPESYTRFITIQKNPAKLDDNMDVRGALLDFIADFANWDNSTVKAYLDTSRALTQAAHEALGGEPGTRPLVVDPFAGGGSIPLEALRVGADAFASDLNPIPVLLNKVVLEYIPQYGQRLADEVRKWGDWIKQEAEKELAEFYPKDPDGATPIAYLWARTIQCEGPGCGAEVPLIRSLWLAKKENRSAGLRMVPNEKANRVDFQIIVKTHRGWVNQAETQDAKAQTFEPKLEGTVKRGSATCPCSGYTTPIARVCEQLKPRRGGADDARLFCVVTTRAAEQGRFYRLSTAHDLKAVRNAVEELERRTNAHTGLLSLIPDESISLAGSYRIIKMLLYGADRWGDIFAARQALILVHLTKLVHSVREQMAASSEAELSVAIQTCLAFVADKMADKASSLCRWKATAEYMGGNTFGRQALPMMWDFCEASVLGEVSGDIASEFD